MLTPKETFGNLGRKRLKHAVILKLVQNSGRRPELKQAQTTKK